jgi:hypothetical protein
MPAVSATTSMRTSSASSLAAGRDTEASAADAAAWICLAADTTSLTSAATGSSPAPDASERCHRVREQSARSAARRSRRHRLSRSPVGAPPRLAAASACSAAPTARQSSRRVRTPPRQRRSGTGRDHIHREPEAPAGTVAPRTRPVRTRRSASIRRRTRLRSHHTPATIATISAAQASIAAATSKATVDTVPTPFPARLSCPLSSHSPEPSRIGIDMIFARRR